MLTWIVIAIVVAVCLYLAFSNARKPRRFQHEGQTYYRTEDGNYLDANRQPVRDAVLLAALGATFATLAVTSDSDSSWNSDSSDDSSNSDGGSSGSDSGSDSAGGGD